MHIHNIQSTKTVRGGVDDDDFMAYSMQSTASKIEKMYTGKHAADENAAKHQSLAPKYFISLAVVYPVIQAVRVL